MMPEVSIYYLMAIFRAFLLIIGHKMNVCMIALDKSGINMKCSYGLKPLCALGGQEYLGGTRRCDETPEVQTNVKFEIVM